MSLEHSPTRQRLEKLLYKTSEAKAVLGCGLTKLYELINSGALEARRFGGQTYITAASLENLVASLPPTKTPTMTERAERRARLNLENIRSEAK